MATRYYTEEAYEQIRNTIDEIQNSDLDPVVDFFSDLLSRIAQYLELYTVDDYQQDIQTWYTKVLDSHNATMNNVDSIFNAVETVDFTFRDIMVDAHSSIVSFRSTVNCLRDIISGKTSLADGKAAAETFLAAGKDALYSSYDAILTKMEAQVRGEAGSALLKNVLKLGAGFCKILTTRDPAKLVIAYKQYIDTWVATLGDLGAITSLFLGAVAGHVCTLFGISYGNYLDIRFDQLSEAKKYNDKNSVTDVLGEIAEGLTEDLAKCSKDSPYYPVIKTAAETFQNGYVASQWMDTATDVADFYYDVNDSFKDAKEWLHGKDYTEKEFLEAFPKKDSWDIIDVKQGDDGLIFTDKIPADEIIPKIISDRTGIPLSGWEDPDKAVGNGFKLAGTIFSYGEKLDPDLASYASGDGDVMDVAIGKVKEVGIVKDGIDLIRDLEEGMPNSAGPNEKQPNSYMRYDRDQHTWSPVYIGSAGGR